MASPSPQSTSLLAKGNVEVGSLNFLRSSPKSTVSLRISMPTSETALKALLKTLS